MLFVILGAAAALTLTIILANRHIERRRREQAIEDAIRRFRQEAVPDAPKGSMFPWEQRQRVECWGFDVDRRTKK